jgi:hypothetical protein
MKKVLRLIIFIGVTVPCIVSGQSLPSKQKQYDFLRWYIRFREIESLSDTTLNIIDNNTINLKDFNKVLSAGSKITDADKSYIN